MHVCVTCKNEENAIKMKVLEWPQHFSHYKSIGIFSNAQGQLIPQSVIGSGRISNYNVRDFMHFLFTCKYEKDPMTNKGEKVATTFFPL